MKNWRNNFTFETVLTIRVNQNNRTQDDTVYTYEDYEPRECLDLKKLK